MSIKRRSILVGGLVAVAASAVPIRAALAAATPAKIELTVPEPSGPYPIGTTELHLVQPGRPDPWAPEITRELMVSLWYPAVPDPRYPRAPYLPSALAELYETEAGVAPLALPTGRIDWRGTRTHARVAAPVLARPGGHPVVLYSPGGLNSRALGTVGAQDLASRGFVVVTVDHPGEAAVEFPGNRIRRTQVPFDITDPAEIERVKERFMAAREADLLFVLDQLEVLAAGGNPDAERRALPRGLGRAMDLSNVGMFGHSAGGLATARAMYADRRIDAGVNMDGWFQFGDNHPERGSDRPFLLLGARSHPQDPVLHGEVRTHLTEPLWRVFWDNSTGWKLDLNVPNGQHYTFTDGQWFLPQLAGPLGIDTTTAIGTVDPTRIVNGQNDYLAAFFAQHLKRQPQRLLTGPSPEYSDLVSFIR
ncbi:alpha/beta hydrolase family protein [Plantactinospora solaniradicis]|uniref:Alpha/beta hydrolase family protein n=1 Tax=Plantactinospora solaniradicis TaxID=1723736 RepID=A0ABW1KGA1_9ACTN